MMRLHTTGIWLYAACTGLAMAQDSAGSLRSTEPAMHAAVAEATRLDHVPENRDNALPPKSQPTPERPPQSHRWALTGGLSRTQTGTWSGLQNTLSLRYQADQGSMAIERLGQQRLGHEDHAWAIDAYPRLWSGAYANLRYQHTPSPAFYPARAWRAELFQNVGTGWEVAASHDFLGFDPGVQINGVSLGKYWGNFFVRWRHQQVQSGTSSNTGDRVFVRYYYRGEADHFVEVNLTRGRSDVFSTGLILLSRSDARGVVWSHFVTRQWGFRLSAADSRDTAGLGNRALDSSISLVRRW